MGGINLMKVLVGGVVAGVVYNVGQSVVHLVLLAESSAAMTESMGAGEPTGSMIAIFWILGFIIGITMIFLYAAMRPRCGPGPMTALYAGVTTFVLAELVPGLFYIASGVLDFAIYLPFLITTLIILCVSAVAGAALYTETEAAAVA